MTTARLWVAEAPVGQWSSGPAVVYEPETADQYRAMGWTVRGPYALQEAPPSPPPASIEAVPGQGVFLIACGTKRPEQVRAIIAALSAALDEV